MEPSNEPISVRVTRLNNELISKSKSPCSANRLISREGLLDALNVLYDECNNDLLKRNDKNISMFVDKFRSSLLELKNLRVNISDFEVKTVIGRGHFGEVHVVREKQTGDVYAMKTLRKSDTLNQQSVSFYEEERDIMAAATSPWLTSLQYAFQDTAHLYLVMEFHPGGDLLGLLERHDGTLSEPFSKFYLAELASAIHALHLMGYVHRDVKPDNVLLDRCGHLKLADFGSAAKLSSQGKVTSQMPVGTPEYIAPEVLKSMEKIGSYGTECDYWSLGIVAYEMIVGCTPFSGAVLTAIYNNIMNFSSTLKFPEDTCISESFRNLICGLLTCANTRFTHDKLMSHEFFKDIDWNCLRDQVPPFVPRVNSIDDTSNFIEFEQKARVPNTDNFKIKAQFSGRNLPFIGFTFTQDVSSNFNSSPCKITSELRTRSLMEEKKKEMKNLQKCFSEDDSSKKEIEMLKKRLSEQIKQMKLSESSRDKLEKQLVLSGNEITHLKRTIEAERLERKELEMKALELIKAAKQKWETAEAERLEKLNKQLETDTQRITDLCTQNNELSSVLERTRNELSATVLEMERLQSECFDYKERMAKVRALNRRSVAGVESRLEKMASESYEQLEDYQQKLKSEINLRSNLENQLRDYKNIEMKMKSDLEVKDNEIRILQSSLKNSINTREEVELLRKNLEDVKNECKTLQNRNENIISELKMSLTQEQRVSERLRKEITTLRTEVENSKKSLDRKESLLKHHQNEMTSLKSQLDQVSNDRKDLQVRLREVQESDELNRSKVSDLEELVSRLEQGVAKLEANDGQEDQIVRLEKQLAAAHESLAIEKQNARTAKSALWRKEKELSDSDLDRKIAERELKCAEEKINALEANVEEMTKQLNNEKDRHERDIDELKVKSAELDKIIRKLEREIMVVNQKHEKDLANWKEQKDNFEIKISQLKKLEVELEKLKNECNECERQRSALKVQVERLSEEKHVLASNIEKSYGEIDRLEVLYDKKNREFENVQLNLTMLREACTMLDGQLEDYEKLVESHENKQKSLSNEKVELEKLVAKTQDEASATKKAANEEKSLRLLAEKQCERLKGEISELKRANENLTSQLSEYKSVCASLNEQLSESDNRISDLNLSITALQRQLDMARSEEVLVKEEAAHHLTLLHTLKQSNLKLAHELDDCKSDVSVLRTHVSELEDKLKEQLAYYQHREVKSEAIQQQQTKLIHYLQSKLEEHNKKKKTFADKIFGSNKKENIPPLTPISKGYQDLETKLQQERTKNRNLTDQLREVRAQLASVRERGKTQEQNSTLKQQITPEIKADFEGWVKIANGVKWEWEKKYIRLCGTKLSIYLNQEIDHYQSVIDLDPKDGTIQIIPDISSSECGNTAPADIPFIFKIESIPSTTCWPQTNYFIMALNSTFKSNCLKHMKNVVKSQPDAVDKYTDLIWKSEIPSDINCVLELDKVYLIGTDKGIYSVTDKNSNVLLNGVSDVHQLTISRHLKLLIMIAGENKQLLKCDLKHIENLSKAASCSHPEISFKLIADEHFHLFELSRTDMMCAATAKKIVIMKYNYEKQNYLPVRMLDTAQPSSCMIFREHSLIVGANKFFEIDLRNFSAEEFLDASDNTLSHVVYSYKLNSFPIAIFEILGEAVEYLLCFNEFGVFVDEFGTRSREHDFKWTKLPLAFAFRKPYLFLVQFNAVEIVKIGKNSCEYDPVRIELNGCRYIGESKVNHLIYVTYGKEMRSIKAIQRDDDSLVDTTDVEQDDNETEFSFTSSMMESLDRDDSCGDGGSEDTDVIKKVKFDSHTAM